MSHRTKQESEAESAETQNWLDYALACGYIDQVDHKKIDDGYSEILGMLVKMQQAPEKWSI